MRTAFLAAFLLAAAGVAHAETDFVRPDIKEWKLPNGLSVVYLGVSKAPVVAVQVWYHVGSKDEPRQLRGSAHMFEHMMFKGTKNLPPDTHMAMLQAVGGIGNAFTREDVTGYQNRIPKQYFDFIMQLEAERMRNLLFRKAMIDTEREVVKEEKRLRIDNSPVGKAFERFRLMAFSSHPYGWTPAGFLEDLDRLTAADLKAFYDSYYQPNNAVLIVVGDVTEAEVKASVDKWFGKVPAGREPPRPSKNAPEGKQTEQRRTVVDAAQLGIVISGYKIPAASHQDQFALAVLGNILSGGESARLYQRVVRKDRVGVAAAGQTMAFEELGLFIVFGVFLSPEQQAPIEAALADEVARLQKEPVTAEELVKAKNQLTAGFVFGLQGVEGLAEQIGQSKIMRGDAKAWLGDYEAYQAVTAADVARVAKAYLVPENLTIVVIPPKVGGGK
jgi:zinc protease